MELFNVAVEFIMKKSVNDVIFLSLPDNFDLAKTLVLKPLRLVRIFN